MRRSLVVWGALLCTGSAFGAACGAGDEFSAPASGNDASAGSGGGGTGGNAGTGGSGGSAASTTGGTAGMAGAGTAGGDGGGCLDEDEDGQSICDGDCDDTDMTTGRGFREICGDSADNDCNGSSDESCGGLGTFVSSLTGDDNNPGTQAQPVATIAMGIARAQQIRAGSAAKIDVYIAQGHYPEKVTLTEGVSLLGGFHCDVNTCTWARSPQSYDTAILNTDFSGVVADATITRATRLDGLRIEGLDGAPPAGTAGSAAITLDGGRPTISVCTIRGADAAGTIWPHGRSAAIHIPRTSDTAGALIMGNTIIGGTSQLAAVGISFTNDPGSTASTAAEVTNNEIRGGKGTAGTAAISAHNSGSTTLIRDNLIFGGESSVAWCFGIEIGGAGTIDANRINVPSNGAAGAKCSSAQAWCGGIGSESSSAVITNNIVFGADAPRSVAVLLGEFERPAGSVALNANYLDGAGQASATAQSAAVVVQIGDCSTCGFAGKVGRIRNNVLLAGVAPASYNVLESAPLGKQMHPEALENNFFGVTGGTPAPLLYGSYDGSTLTISTGISLVNALTSGGMTASANLSGDPMVDSAFHLLSGSPCIDKGTSVEAPAKDFDGQTRPIGTAIDIGADERQ